MTKTTKDQKILFIIFMSIMFSAFLFMVFRAMHEQKRVSKEYPQVLISDSINNRIIYKYHVNTNILRVSISCADVMLDNKRKISLNTHINGVYKDPYQGVNNVIEIGDSVVKHKGSDTIYIYKQYSHSKKYDYFFIIETTRY